MIFVIYLGAPAFVGTREGYIFMWFIAPEPIPFHSFLWFCIVTGKALSASAYKHTTWHFYNLSPANSEQGRCYH